jgi:uncharacterized Ntn-hydrolase superfamily protein
MLVTTFSIVAADIQESAWGIAVASKFPAVGAVVPWASAQAGAVATQSYANTTYGPRGLALMAQGVSAEEALQSLIQDDDEPDLRQVGMVDAQGRPATFTGNDCYEWAGGETGSSYAVQGNILTGPETIKAMADAYDKTDGDLPDRLIAALLAGDRAGGDRRGRQSAAILIVKPEGGYGGYNDRWIDYRVDDHTDPVPRLMELVELHRLHFGESSEGDQIQLPGKPLEALQEIMIALGYYSGPTDGEYNEATRAALRQFIGNENFEERVDFENANIDKPIFEFLVKKFEG